MSPPVSLLPAPGQPVRRHRVEVASVLRPDRVYAGQLLQGAEPVVRLALQLGQDPGDRPPAEGDDLVVRRVIGQPGAGGVRQALRLPAGGELAEARVLALV